MVYLWVDGVYVKAGLEKERAALLVAIAGLVDGRKEVVAVVPGYRESVESWAGVLRDLRDRGLPAPRLVIGDGHLGIWGALRNVRPEADEQRCWKGAPTKSPDFVGDPSKSSMCWSSCPAQHGVAKVKLGAMA